MSVNIRFQEGGRSRIVLPGKLASVYHPVKHSLGYKSTDGSHTAVIRKSLKVLAAEEQNGRY